MEQLPCLSARLVAILNLTSNGKPSSDVYDFDIKVLVGLFLSQQTQVEVLCDFHLVFAGV